jgi:hypothetical protein
MLVGATSASVRLPRMIASFEPQDIVTVDPVRVGARLSWGQLSAPVPSSSTREGQGVVEGLTTSLNIVGCSDRHAGIECTYSGTASSLNLFINWGLVYIVERTKLNERRT